MYLRRLHVLNNGPLRRLDLELPVSAEGVPKPVILVGGNGSGKTNLLSIIADALFEAASKHYRNAVEGGAGFRRPWFRLAGGATISIGAEGGCSILEFQQGEKSYLFKEKAGRLPAQEVLEQLPEPLRAAAEWSEEGIIKEIKISDDEARKVFHDGAYVYFHSSRAEVPHWLNRDAVKVDDFDFTRRISHSLQKPIFVERSLDQLKQWLLSVLIDARIDFTLLPDPKDDKKLVVFTDDNIVNAIAAYQNKILWGSINHILKAIFDDTSVSLVWLGRHSLGRLSIQRDGAIIMPTLDGLSAGQATVLSIFGTLLRYGDAAGPGLGASGRIEGICLIDEIDAHMHVDLQHRALPELIKMFPKVQFIVSSHSPLFVLGSGPINFWDSHAH